MFIVVVCLRQSGCCSRRSSGNWNSAVVVSWSYFVLFLWFTFLLADSDWLAGMCNNTQHGTEAEVHWPVSETMITRAFKMLWCRKLLHCLLHFLLVLQSFVMCVCESLSACMCKWVHFAFTGLLPVTSQLCRTVENSCTASLSYVGG